MAVMDLDTIRKCLNFIMLILILMLMTLVLMNTLHNIFKHLISKIILL